MAKIFSVSSLVIESYEQQQLQARPQPVKKNKWGEKEGKEKPARFSFFLIAGIESARPDQQA
jgi:hypothetical protein